MNKKTVFWISVVVNIILALVLIVLLAKAGGELKFNYVEEDTIAPDTIRSNLERENYGVAAVVAHPIRGGADIADEYMDYYMLGEYADLLFIKEIYVKSGNTQTVAECDKRLEEIRSSMPDYGSLFDKIDYSEKNAIAK